MAAWRTSPAFTVETMAAVIDRVRTAPASAHKNTIQEAPGPIVTPNVDQQQTGEKTRRHTVYLFVCVFCVCNSVKAFWGRVE